MRRVAECRVRLNCKLNPMFWQNSVEAKLSRRDDDGDDECDEEEEEEGEILQMERRRLTRRECGA